MEKNIDHYGFYYEQPPVEEQDYDLDVVDEPSRCSSCALQNSGFCEICFYSSSHL